MPTTLRVARVTVDGLPDRLRLVLNAPTERDLATVPHTRVSTTVVDTGQVVSPIAEPVVPGLVQVRLYTGGTREATLLVEIPAVDGDVWLDDLLAQVPVADTTGVLTTAQIGLLVPGFASDGTVVDRNGNPVIGGGGYAKPGTGIPAADLAATVQAQLTNTRTPTDASVTNAKLDAPTKALVAKAGTSVQTVNGTSPDGTGNVTFAGGGTTDAGALTGTLAPARIADGSLPAAKVIGVASQAGLTALTQAVASDLPTATGYSYAIADQSGRVALGVRPDGSVEAKIANAEVLAARGTAPSLSARLARTSTPSGITMGSGGWSALESNLRWSRMLTRRLKYGDTPTKFNVALIGDSYTQYPDRWSRPFWQGMTTEYGDGGVGWVGFGSYNGLPSGLNVCAHPFTTVVKTGTWDDATYFGVTGPDLGETASSTVGDTIEVNFPAGQSNGALFYFPGPGSINYQFNNGGAVNALSLNTAVCNVPLVGCTPTSTKLTITVAAASARLCGVSIVKSTDGVVVHKLGASGGTTNYFAAAGDRWKNNIAALAPRLVVVMFGPNDQASLSPAQFAANQQSIASNLRTALGAGAFDLLFMMPPENQRGLATKIADFATATLPVADANQAAFIDLQPLFGVSPADYSSTSARPWFSSDNTHPDPPTGGRVIADAALRLVTQK